MLFIFSLLLFQIKDTKKKIKPSAVDIPFLVPLPAPAAAARPPAVVVAGRDVPRPLPLPVRPLTTSRLGPARIRVLVGADVVDGMRGRHLNFEFTDRLGRLLMLVMPRFGSGCCCRSQACLDFDSFLLVGVVRKVVPYCRKQN